jgi:hypothetical protein
MANEYDRFMEKLDADEITNFSVTTEEKDLADLLVLFLKYLAGRYCIEYNLDEVDDLCIKFGDDTSIDMNFLCKTVDVGELAHVINDNGNSLFSELDKYINNQTSRIKNALINLHQREYLNDYQLLRVKNILRDLYLSYISKGRYAVISTLGDIANGVFAIVSGNYNEVPLFTKTGIMTLFYDSIYDSEVIMKIAKIVANYLTNELEDVCIKFVEINTDDERILKTLDIYNNLYAVQHRVLNIHDADINVAVENMRKICSDAISIYRSNQVYYVQFKS